MKSQDQTMHSSSASSCLPHWAYWQMTIVEATPGPGCCTTQRLKLQSMYQGQPLPGSFLPTSSSYSQCSHLLEFGYTHEWHHQHPTQSQSQRQSKKKTKKFEGYKGRGAKCCPRRVFDLCEFGVSMVITNWSCPDLSPSICEEVRVWCVYGHHELVLSRFESIYLRRGASLVCLWSSRTGLVQI
jgi:hypothetical protein